MTTNTQYKQYKLSLSHILSILAQIEEHGPAKPEENCYYRTFNGSIVHITAGGESSGNKGLWTGMFTAFTDGDTEDWKTKKEKSEVVFTGTVVKGGHGLSEYRGSCVGESYTINADGVIKISLDQFKQTPLLFGMTLKEPVLGLRELMEGE